MEDRLNIKHHQCSPTPSRFHGGLSCLGNAYSLCMLQHLSLFRQGKGDAASGRQFGIKSLSHAHLPDSEGLSPEAHFHGHSASTMGSKQSVPCRGMADTKERLCRGKVMLYMDGQIRKTWELVF